MNKLSTFCLVFFLLSFPLSKDSDCINKTSVTSQTDCTSIKTGTMSICCYASYIPKNESNPVKKCLLADGSTPQTILASITSLKTEFPSDSTSQTVQCGTNAEVCQNIQNPTTFANCNVTEQEYPFSCCLIQTRAKASCFPVNARYNTTVAAYASSLQSEMNYTTTPEITCSNNPLPAPLSHNILYINKFFLIMSLIIFL